MEYTIPSALFSLINSRKGGVYNTRGIIYQANYTVWRLLKEFSSPLNKEMVFRPEGIEDLDFHFRLSDKTISEYIQVKCLDEKLDVDLFVKNILKNLLEVYVLAPESKFKVVSNVHVSGGNLNKIKEAYGKNSILQQSAFDYWASKIRETKFNLSDHKIRDFLTKIQFERKPENELISEALKLLIEHFEIVQGNEEQYHTALFRSVLDWSLHKKEIQWLDFLSIIENTRDARLENQALRNAWITEIFFENLGDTLTESAYFEGKPAQPHHIAANLPVTRPELEKLIIDSIGEFDVTVVKSSSGQGKSTLAWQSARSLMTHRFRVFELHEVPDAGIHDLFLFLKSRVKIGINPLVVIDGLNSRVKNWGELAAKAQELRGVKFLVTTREEDWFRFGNMVSCLYLKAINIELKMAEAQRIFEAFRKRGLIHSSMRAWQIAWDKVKSEKLLIEFVYLITQGKMLRERLENQLQMMRSEPENKDKKAILRLVSMADTLNLRLLTANLMTHLKSEIKFDGDRDDLLQSLKNEYHIQIEGAEYIEGLHPVRSKHLSELLHNSIPVVETLVNLAALLEANALTDFAIRSPRFLHTKTQKERFFELLIQKFYDKSYSEILHVVNGIFGADAYQHWQENKEIYDKVSTKGLMLYTAIKTPFGNLESSSFDVIAEINPEFNKNLKAITSYELTASNVFLFLKSLHPKLRACPLKQSLGGSLDLERWFRRFNLSIDLPYKLTIESMSNAIEDLDVNSLGQVIRGIFLINEPFFYQFYSEYGKKLMLKLLRDTNTLQIEETNNSTLEIKYIADEEISAHEQSKERLRVIAYCMPCYKEYKIEGLQFSHPFLTMIKSKYDESVKSVTWEGWLKYDPFETKANSIWVSAIETGYEFSTQFEWQEYWFVFRKKFVEWLRQSSRVLEAAMDEKRDYKKEEFAWKTLTQQIFNEQEREKQIHYDDYFTEARFKELVKKIEGWSSKSNTVIFQYSKIADENTRKLLELNAHELLLILPQMQSAYEEISLHTGNYFDIQELIKPEINAHRYFSEITKFYHEVFSPRPRLLTNARQEIKNWIEQEHKKEFEKLKAVKTSFDSQSGYELILPEQILEESYYNSIILGISNVSTSDFEQNAVSLLTNLLGLLNVDASFFYLVLIENGVASKNLALRFQKESLQKFQDLINGEEIEFSESFFLPMPLTLQILEYLPGIQLAQVDEDDIFMAKVLQLQKVLWEYSETNQRLNSSFYETIKSQKTKILSKQIQNRLDALRDRKSEFEKYKLIFENVLSGTIQFDANAIKRSHKDSLN